MKSRLLVSALVLAATGVHAESFFQIEAGLGVAHSQAGADGLWRWDTKNPVMHDTVIVPRIGLQMNISEPDRWIPGVRAHLFYVNYGSVHWSGIAGQDPDAGHTFGFDHTTGTCFNNNCGLMRRFVSTGAMQAFALTVEPFYRFGNGWTVGLEAGPAAFRSTWTATATNLTTNDTFGAAGAVEVYQRKPRWQFGQMVGASVSKGNFTLRYEYLRAPGDGKLNDGNSSVSGKTWVPSGVVGQHLVTLNYVW